MSSLVKTCLHHLGYLVIAALFMSPAHAAGTAAEEVWLTLNGKKLEVVGRKACDDTTSKVDLVLTTNLKLKNDFDVLYKKIERVADATKAKAETHNCPASRPSGEKMQGSFNKSSPTLMLDRLIKASGSQACQPDGASERRVICIYEGGGGSTDLLAYAFYSIETSVAKITSIGDRTAVNGEVSFDVNVTGQRAGALRVETCFGKTADGNIDADEKECPTNFKIHYTDSTNVKITGLEPVEYSFKVRLNDEKDGPTPWFKPSFNETPIPVAFPFSQYNGNGGELQFNCQQTHSPGGMLLLLTTLVGLLLLRVREKLTGPLVRALLVIALFIVPQDVRAHFGQINFGLLGSMYRPNLDSEVLADGAKVFPFYKCFYRKKTSDKEGPILPLLGGEVNMHLFDGFGSLQLGLGLGYTFVNGHAVKIDAAGNIDCDAIVSNAESTLHLYQVRPQLTYVLDYFADWFPLIPYIRGAMIGQGYIFRNGSSQPPNVTLGDHTTKPNGFRLGYNGAVGLKFMLDFLEPSAMTSARGQGYLDHVYLKAELAYTKIDTFGRRGFQFSPKDVMGTSLPLMWTFGLEFELP